MTNRTTRARSGFAMITALWVLSVAGSITTAAALAGRNTIDGAVNRVHLERAYWVASGCMARVRGAIDARLSAAASLEEAALSWRLLNWVAATDSIAGIEECAVHVEAAGSRLDVNMATDDMLSAALTDVVSPTEVASLVDALVDWRDGDSVARPNGAEASWYASEQRELPSNASLADIRELGLVRGFENRGRMDTLFSVEAGRVSLATAPVAVLLAVPGITRETAEQIAALSAAATPIRDPLSLLGTVSRTSADTLLARYADLTRIATADPDAWVMTVSAADGTPVIHASIEIRIVRTGRRSVVVRTRTTP